MKLWLGIALGVLLLVGCLIIYALCQVSGLQSGREDRVRKTRMSERGKG